MRVIIFLLLLFLSNFIYSQVKHDNVWLFGYDSDAINPIYGGSVMDFNTLPATIYSEDRLMNLDFTNASICDTAGNLLFYTNGIYVANVLGELMENGDSLSPGDFTSVWVDEGMPLIQGAMILPKPGSDSLYYLFHCKPEYPIFPISVHTSNLLYSIIDMSKNNGLGAVIEKNQAILQDTLGWAAITGVKHANGLDWWVLMKEYDSNRYYKVLLTPDGVVDYGAQAVGESITTGLEQAVFSPDGSKYAFLSLVSVDEGDYLSIFDFDRCTGELTNPVIMHSMDTMWFGGLAISPNSRFLYVSFYRAILQYDLQAPDVAASKKIVAEYDGYEEEVSPGVFFPTRFFFPQLAPDGKIYINSTSSVRSLHVINQPDLEGMACDVQQHSVMLPTLNKFSLPNFPNYRLGALPGSPCDTLTAVNEVGANNNVQFKIYPNPASASVTVEYLGTASFDIVLYDITGSMIRAQRYVGNGAVTVQTTDLPSGVYWCRLFRDGLPVYSQRVAIFH